MTEVITLSDDDDYLGTSTPREEGGITVNVKNGSPLTFADIYSEGAQSESYNLNAKMECDLKIEHIIGLNGVVIPFSEGISRRTESVESEVITIDDEEEEVDDVDAPVLDLASYTKTLEKATSGPDRMNLYEQMTVSQKETFMRQFLIEAIKKHSMFDRTLRKKPTVVQFFCSFGYEGNKCNRLISGQINFMHHLWSHAAVDELPRKGDHDKLDRGTDRIKNNLEVAKLSTCSYCCRHFKSPYLAANHYHKCHGREVRYDDGVCFICEREIAKISNLKEHMKLSLNEAPYVCQMCTYRASTRDFLIHHFTKEHFNGAGLLCPLCCKCIRIPSHYRNRPQVHCEEFVKHMMAHAEAAESSHQCSRCALIFLTNDDKKFHYVNDHGPIGKGYTITYRKRLIRRNRTKDADPQSRIKQLQKLYMKSGEGVRVHDEVACTSSVERLGYDNSVTGVSKYVCECGFSTHNGNRLASHFHRCGKNFKTEREAFQNVKKQSWDEEKEEAILFGYHPLIEPEKPKAETFKEVRREDRKFPSSKKADNGWKKMQKKSTISHLKCTMSSEDWRTLAEKIYERLE